MYNWSTDTTSFDKSSDEYKIWRLEQLINFGLDGEKIKRKELEEYFDRLTIDPEKKVYLQFLLK